MAKISPATTEKLELLMSNVMSEIPGNFNTLLGETEAVKKACVSSGSGAPLEVVGLMSITISLVASSLAFVNEISIRLSIPEIPTVNVCASCVWVPLVEKPTNARPVLTN